LVKFNAQSARVIELVKELKDSESRSKFWSLIDIMRLRRVQTT